MNKRTQPTTLALLGTAMLAGTLHAEPPMAPPAKLPTTPAEVAVLIKTTDEARLWHDQLIQRRSQASNDRNLAVNALRNGAFKKAGGLDDPTYKALLAKVTDLDTQMKAKSDAAAVADKAGDKDEKMALEIEAQRLRVTKDMTQAEAEAFVIQRCLALPDGKEAAEQARLLMQQAKEADEAVLPYWENVRSKWNSLAAVYQQKAQGMDYKKTRSITLPPPADAARRRTEFTNRNDPAELEQLAHRLFNALDEKAPGVDKAFALYRERKFAEALDAFRDHFLHKLTHFEQFGIPAEAIITDGFAPLSPVLFPDAWLDDAMRGIGTTANPSVGREELLKIDFGPPGTVNWTHLPPEPLNAQKQPESLHLMRPLHLLESESLTNGLLGWLLQGYQRTGEAKCLHRWSEYADDWALNVQRSLNALPASELEAASYQPNLPLMWNERWYHTLSPRVLATFVTRVRATALTHPGFAKEMPAPTLARVLLTGLEEYATPNILVARATRFNWNHMGLSFNMRNALMLGEFKTGQWLGRETARTLQNHALFSIMPDGGYVEYSDEGHQGVWLQFGLAGYELLQASHPAWFDAALDADLRWSLEQNGMFFLRHLKPDGLRHRDSYRDARSAYVGKTQSVFAKYSLDLQLPGLTSQEEPARMLDTVFGKGTLGAPRHRSDVMPYLGEFMLRGGWGKTDAFFYMHSGRIPNSNPDEDCNAFKLHNHGQHLLTAQPVYVDGRTQNMHFKHVDNVGAKTAFLTHSDGIPTQGRWHTSDRFDLAEGVYEGAYEDRSGRTYWSPFHTGGYDLKHQQRSLGLPAVTDVQRHTRQVFFVREPECWVVVDRIRCDARHDYEIPYEVYTPVQRLDWLRRTKTPVPNADKRAVIEENRVRTDNPGYPKITIRHFGNDALKIEFDPKSHDLAHKDRNEVQDADGEWKTSTVQLRNWMAFVRRVLVKWNGAGDQVLVTFITTAPENGEPSWAVKASGTTFTATAPDGGSVHFAASAKPAALNLSGVTTDADTLLIAKPKSGNAQGIVLGARSLKVGAQSLSLNTDSAEFTLGKQPAITREIHAPIQPVAFKPDVNVFTDHADVTMTSATPDVSIRYTLDGTEPTLASPLYTKPMRIDQSAQVRAIAVRAGAKELHWPLDPGFATLPTRAVFTKQTASPALKIKATAPGLAWEYIEGQSFALVAASGFVPARKVGTTTRLLDASMHQSGSAFTARYSSYLDVPADGVYTFHAPREFIIPDIDPGYDLRVILDGEEWWPAMRQHALGTWSRALAKGLHKLQVVYTDTRTKPFKHETWMNWPNPAVLWKGEAPVLEISGPGLSKQPIPDAWLRKEK
ncbi:MAG: Chitobiase/beta-hexosaminidase C-terminal domain-containing protein [Verrucomicrobia bacterium]|nr:MAG: Chitobiase/beta-hexosaminidase C-terminal domain-containing protein [Verrucomicrobiota bacterium]